MTSGLNWRNSQLLLDDSKRRQQPAGPASTATSANTQNSPFDRLLIAIIEDDRDDYIIIERMLRRTRLHEVASIHFDTVFKAQSWLSRNTPDLIITDYMMDGVGEGVGLISTLAETGVQAPVIMITGAKDDTVDLEALNAGAYDYLDKSSLNAAILERSIRYSIQRYGVERQLRQSQRQLAASAKIAQEAAAARTLMMSKMTHELRTPLNAIIGFSDVIRSEQLMPDAPAKAREYATDISECGLHLMNLLNSVLDVERAAADRHSPDETVFPVDAEIERARRMVDHTLTRHNISFTVNDNILGVKLRADARMVRQIILNLLTNAGRYCHDHGRVSISLRALDVGVAIVVADDGPGMTAQEIDIALTTYGRAQNDGADAEAETGAGLGLPIYRQLMELHGGQLTIESEKGAGCTIVLTFPAERIAA